MDTELSLSTCVASPTVMSGRKKTLAWSESDTIVLSSNSMSSYLNVKNFKVHWFSRQMTRDLSIRSSPMSRQNGKQARSQHYCTNRRTDGRLTDRKWTGGIEKSKNAGMDGGWMDGGWMDGWMNGWTEGTDGLNSICTEGQMNGLTGRMRTERKLKSLTLFHHTVPPHSSNLPGRQRTKSQRTPKMWISMIMLSIPVMEEISFLFMG